MAFETLLCETAASGGLRAAIRDRDRPFGDYSQAPTEDQPRRDHRIRVHGRRPA